MATINKHCKEAISIAKTINPEIKIINSINWIWANGFKTKEDAETFDYSCRFNGCETRGVYSGNDGTFDVRFR